MWAPKTKYEMGWNNSHKKVYLHPSDTDLILGLKKGPMPHQPLKKPLNKTPTAQNYLGSSRVKYCYFSILEN